MFAVPTLVPVTIPVLIPTLAVEELLLVHVPAPAALLRVVVAVLHKLAVPLLAPGIAFTVTCAVDAQPTALV
jgi:NADH:ubiquinone oxidoreductase subunit D